jgi:hypothetical protein
MAKYKSKQRESHERDQQNKPILHLLGILGKPPVSHAKRGANQCPLPAKRLKLDFIETEARSQQKR